jgi:hypothetical protein
MAFASGEQHGVDGNRGEFAAAWTGPVFNARGVLIEGAGVFASRLASLEPERHPLQTCVYRQNVIFFVIRREYSCTPLMYRTVRIDRTPPYTKRDKKKKKIPRRDVLGLV